MNEDLQPEDCISLYYQHSDRSRRSKHCTWLQASGYKEGDGHFFLYTVSLYWSLTVISTVGFGDYTPLNSHEKLYTCFVIVAGVACYSLIISSVAKIFDSRDKTSTLEWRTRVLNRFVHKYRIPTYLAFALHSHNQRHFEMGHHWRNEANEASKLIESLSRPLYRILALHLEEKLITQIPFFRGKPNAFVADAVVLLTPLLAVSGETILNMGSVADALHLIISGSISIRKPDDNVTRELGAMKKGSYFGDEGCLLNAVFIGDLDAVDSVSFELITRDSLHKLLDSFPNVRESLVQTAKYRLKFSGILRVRRDAQQAQRLLIDDGTTREHYRKFCNLLCSHSHTQGLSAHSCSNTANMCHQRSRSKLINFEVYYATAQAKTQRSEEPQRNIASLRVRRATSCRKDLTHNL